MPTQICDELNRLETVGQFQQLVELSEMNPDLKHKVGVGGLRTWVIKYTTRPYCEQAGLWLVVGCLDWGPLYVIYLL